MDWKLFLDKTKKDFVSLSEEIPDTFKGFSLMGKEAKKNGLIDEKTKEFVALGIAISTRCESCIGFHVESLIRLKTTRDELIEVLAMCSYMGGGPSITFSTKALEAFDQLSNKN
jgi:AhpD family alkylhydroperoxidase